MLLTINKTVLLLAALSFLDQYATAQAYVVDDIGVLNPGSIGEESRGERINNKGEVVGLARTVVSGIAVGFPAYWGGGTLMKLGAHSGHGFDINYHSVSVGFAKLPSEARYWPTPSHSGLSVPGLSTPAASHGCNFYGWITGKSQTSSNPLSGVGFLYDSVTGSLATFNGLSGTLTIPRDLNDTFVICGDATTASGDFHGFVRFSPTSSVDVGTLGGSNSYMSAINNLNVAVGGSENAAGTELPAAYDAIGAGLTALAPLVPEGEGWAQDVNQFNQIVGTCHDAVGSNRACLWPSLSTPNTVIDLNTTIPATSGWVLQIAFGINDLGEITGSGLLNGQVRGFRLRPVEVPVFSGLQPIIPGKATALSTYGFTAGTMVYFVRGVPGSTSIPGCSTPLGLSNTILVGSAVADAQGRAHLNSIVPAGPPGITIYSQAFSQTACEVSPVVIQISL